MRKLSSTLQPRIHLPFANCFTKEGEGPLLGWNGSTIIGHLVTPTDVNFDTTKSIKHREQTQSVLPCRPGNSLTRRARGNVRINTYKVNINFTNFKKKFICTFSLAKVGYVITL